MDYIQTIRDRIYQFILQQFPLARQQALGDDDALLGSGIIDSMGVLDIVNFLESEFRLTVSDEDLVLENFESISALSTFVRSRLNGSAQYVLEA